MKRFKDASSVVVLPKQEKNTGHPHTSWSRLTSTLFSSSSCLALVKREEREEVLGLYRMEARTNSSRSLLRSHSVMPGSRLCSRAS